MGHPIHKHMNSGMSRASSAEKFDAKEAYNKDLSSKARMHYLENDIADKKGSPARMEGGRKDHKMSNSEYNAHLQSPKGKKEHGAGMSRYGSDYSDSPAELTAGGKKKIMASDANPAFKEAIGNSPIDNISYGDKSGKTGYIGGMSRYESVKKERKDLNTINPVDDKAGMSRYKSDAQRKAVHASKADKGMSRAKYGGNKGDESMSKRDY
jgi:hypothetical protein